MFIIACCIPRGSQPAWLLRRFSQATIRTADGAATLIGPAQRNFARRRWRGKVDGVSWQRLGMDRACGAAPAKEGRNALGGGQCLRRVAVWKDRAGGAIALT